IDADTLARLPLLAPQSLRPLVLPNAAQASLSRRVRACHRLVRDIARSKVRIKALVRALLPMTPLSGALSKTDLAILERTGADPQRLVKLGLSGLSRLATKASAGHLGREYAEYWLAAARDALALYDGHRAMAYEDHAAEIMTEVALLHAYQAQLALQEKAREDAYLRADPLQLARSLPGVAEVGGPVLTALVGEVTRFPSAAHFRSYTGLAPQASETGDSDRKGQRMSKAGPDLLRTTLIRAADTARQQDPQLARIYYLQMTASGAPHLKALCVVASHLALRLYRVLRRGSPYQVCDIDGRPVSAAEAKELIKANWMVPEEVRRKRRSRKTRKAPQQVLVGDAKRTLRARARRPSSTPILPPSSERETPARLRTCVPT
ncbi:MAG: transposase, partial [Streptomyces sp.]|nr:transposase [Streptomyces sp.]